MYYDVWINKQCKEYYNIMIEQYAVGGMSTKYNVYVE